MGNGEGEGEGGGEGMEKKGYRQASRELAASLGSVKPSCGFVREEDARAVLADLTTKHRVMRARSEMLKQATVAEDTVGSRDVRNAIAHLRKASLAINELLRHFWACFPLSSSQRETRVRRIRKVLDSKYEELEKYRTSQGDGMRQVVTPLIRPILQACDAAFTKGDENGIT